MNNLSKIQQEIDSVVSDLGENTRAVFLIKRLAASLSREVIRRIALEKDVIEQRDYIESLYSTIGSLEKKVELLKAELKHPTRRK
jgi:uncharacterized coiled-coil protein SlyX